MYTLSEVSKYLNDLENMLDDGDSTTKVEELIEVGTELEKADAMNTMVSKKKVMEKMKREVVVFTKAHSREYCEPFMRFSTPCGVDGNEACDAELNLAYCDNYIMEEMLNMIGFIRLDCGDCGRKMVKDVRVKIHGYDFHVDFVVLEYGNEREPSVVFGRNFLIATKSQVDFGLGETRIDITMLKEDRDVDTLLANLVEDMVEIREMSSEVVKIGKANRIKNYNVNKITPPTLPKIEEIPPPSSSTSQPIFYPLLPKQKDNILEALDRKYKELEEENPILEVVDNYMVYRKKMD
ncbi:DNA-directed DNA polymerase [Tanacetum coccineum]